MRKSSERVEREGLLMFWLKDDTHFEAMSWALTGLELDPPVGNCAVVRGNEPGSTRSDDGTEVGDWTATLPMVVR